MTNSGRMQSMWGTVLAEVITWVLSEELTLQLRSAGRIHMVGCYRKTIPE